VTDEPFSLFDLPSASEPTPLQSPAIKDKQVQEIRRRFESTGLVSQDDRKRTIESLLSREVAGLSDLSSFEGSRLIAYLAGIDPNRTKPSTSRSSTWDDREEDTWIDKL
jgi:hypothetical protein